MKLAQRPPNSHYPLGYGKEIYFWSFIVALMLFSVGGMFSIYEGAHKLQHPEPFNKPYIAIGVLIFAIVAESLSMWGCLNEVNKVRGEQSLMQWFKTSRQSALVVIFGEDLAATLGLIFALVAVVLSMVTGNPIYDAYGTLTIGILLIVIAILIGREVKQLLIGQSVEPKLQQEMHTFLLQQDGVEEIFNLLTLQLGDDVMVAVKAKLNMEMNAKQLIEKIKTGERAFKERFPQVMWLFFEPDVSDE
jgi:cation diffusion facilitator family transporter